MALDASELKQLASLLGDVLGPRIREAVAENVAVRVEALGQLLREEQKGALDGVQAAIAKLADDFKSEISSVTSTLASKSDEILVSTKDEFNSRLEELAGAANNKLDLAAKRSDELAQDVENLSVEVCKRIEQVRESIPQPVEPVELVADPLVVSGELSDEMRAVMDIVVRETFNPMLRTAFDPLHSSISEITEAHNRSLLEITELRTTTDRAVAGVLETIDGVVGSTNKQIESAAAETRKLVDGVAEEAKAQAASALEEIGRTQKSVTETLTSMSGEVERVVGLTAKQIESVAFETRKLVDEVAEEVKAQAASVLEEIGLTQKSVTEVSTALSGEVERVAAATLEKATKHADEAAERTASQAAESVTAVSLSLTSIADSCEKALETALESTIAHIENHGKELLVTVARQLGEVQVTLEKEIQSVASEVSTVKDELVEAGATTGEAIQTLGKAIAETRTEVVDVIDKTTTLVTRTSEMLREEINDKVSSTGAATLKAAQEVLDGAVAKMSQAIASEANRANDTETTILDSVAEMGITVAAATKNIAANVQSIEELTTAQPALLREIVDLNRSLEQFAAKTTIEIEAVRSSFNETIAEARAEQAEATVQNSKAITAFDVVMRAALLDTFEAMSKGTAEVLRTVEQTLAAHQEQVAKAFVETDARVEAAGTTAQEACDSLVEVRTSFAKMSSENVEKFATMLAQEVSDLHEKLQSACDVLKSHGEELVAARGHFTITEEAIREVDKAHVAHGALMEEAMAVHVATLESLKELLESRATTLEDMVKILVQGVRESTEIQIKESSQEVLAAQSKEVEALLDRVRESSAAASEALSATRGELEKQIDATILTDSHLRAAINEQVSELEGPMLGAAKQAAETRMVELLDTMTPEVEALARTAAIGAVPAVVSAQLEGLPETLAASLVPLAAAEATRVATEACEPALAAAVAAGEVAQAAVKAAAGEAATSAATIAVEALRAPLLEALDPAERIARGIADALPAVAKTLAQEVCEPAVQAAKTAGDEARAAVQIAASAAAQALRESLMAVLDPTERIGKAIREMLPITVRDEVKERLAEVEPRVFIELAGKIQREIDREIDRIPKVRDGEPGKDGKDSRVLAPVPYEQNKRYESGVWVAYDHGVWVSARNTDAEPSPESPDWDCVVPGVKAIEVLLNEDGRTVEMHFALTNGDFQKTSVKLPIPIARGVYDPARVYDTDDLCTYDGSWFEAMKSGVLPRPGTDSTAWKLSVKRGQNGIDRKQPPPPILKYMGEWEADTLYETNQIVGHAGVRWLAMRSTRERPPFTTLQSNDTWTKLGA